MEELIYSIESSITYGKEIYKITTWVEKNRKYSFLDYIYNFFHEFKLKGKRFDISYNIYQFVPNALKRELDDIERYKFLFIKTPAVDLYNKIYHIMEDDRFKCKLWIKNNIRSYD